MLSFFSDFLQYNIDTHEIKIILDGHKKDTDQGRLDTGIFFMLFLPWKYSMIETVKFSMYYDIFFSDVCTYIVFIDFVVPASGFTQRATIDPALDEIHVLSVS